MSYTPPPYTDVGSEIVSLSYTPPPFTDVGGDVIEIFGGVFTVELANLFSPAIFAFSSGENQFAVAYNLTSNISFVVEASNPILMAIPVPITISVDSVVIPFDQMTVQVPITFSIDMNTDFTPVPQMNGVLRIRF